LQNLALRGVLTGQCDPHWKKFAHPRSSPLMFSVWLK